MSRECFRSFHFLSSKKFDFDQQANPEIDARKREIAGGREHDLRSTVSHSGTLTLPLVQKHARYSWLHRCRAQRI